MPDPLCEVAPRSVIEHVEETVRHALGIASTRHRSAMRDLRLPPGQDLVDLIFRTVVDNYERGMLQPIAIGQRRTGAGSDSSRRLPRIIRVPR